MRTVSDARLVMDALTWNVDDMSLSTARALSQHAYTCLTTPYLTTMLCHVCAVLRVLPWILPLRVRHGVVRTGNNATFAALRRLRMDVHCGPMYVPDPLRGFGTRVLHAAVAVDALASEEQEGERVAHAIAVSGCSITVHSWAFSRRAHALSMRRSLLSSRRGGRPTTNAEV